MARPQKNGLDYFPLDVDIDQDDKIALIEAQHGLIGFAIVIKLLMKIYKNSYFYEWTEKEQLLFSKRINVDINSINVVINDCIKWGLFDRKLLESEKILTSKGVQARYLEAVGRRTKVEIKKEYLLLDEDIVNAYKNLVIVDINSNNEDVSDNINPQSKVKESKEKKSKGEERKEDKKDICRQLSSIWTSNGYGTLNKTLLDKLLADVEIYSIEWVIKAMEIGNQRSKRTYSYLKGILENWKTEGYKEGENGSTRQDTKPSQSKWDKYQFE